MSVLIKGMDMPKLCGDCPFYSFKKHHPDGVVCKAEIYTDDRNTRYDDCPLVEVPTPHGRLIDADKLFTWFEGDSLAKYPIGDAKQYNTIMYYEVFDEIDDAPTVIEAEEG